MIYVCTFVFNNLFIHIVGDFYMWWDSMKIKLLSVDGYSMKKERDKLCLKNVFKI